MKRNYHQKIINMQKDFFIIGDVHGCLKTFQELMDISWDKEKEILVQLGDLIDRGAYSPHTLQYCIDLENQHPGKTIFLRGNHEQMLLDFYAGVSSSWLSNGGKESLIQSESAEIDIRKLLPWIEQRKLFFESEQIHISHAGRALNVKDTKDPRHPNGLLWNREPLKNLGKTQVIGHTPLNNGKPFYTSESNSWNIDTGAYKGICLTGIKLDHHGNYLEHLSVPTKEEDLL